MSKQEIILSKVDSKVDLTDKEIDSIITYYHKGLPVTDIGEYISALYGVHLTIEDINSILDTYNEVFC